MRHSGGNTVLPPEDKPRLSDLGVTKKQSSDWQRMATVPDKVEWGREWKQDDDRIAAEQEQIGEVRSTPAEPERVIDSRGRSMPTSYNTSRQTAATVAERDRRNLSGKDLDGFQARAIEALDKVRPHGGDRQSAEFKASGDALNGKSAATTADLVGASARTVERVRAVLVSRAKFRRET